MTTLPDRGILVAAMTSNLLKGPSAMLDVWTRREGTGWREVHLAT